MWSVPSVRWAAPALALFAAKLAAQLLHAPAWSWWARYPGVLTERRLATGATGLRALHSRTLDVDLLMVVAAAGAASIGQIVDGGLLIVMFATSGVLEDAATKRTEDSVQGLLDLAPERAVRIGAGGSE